MFERFARITSNLRFAIFSPPKRASQERGFSSGTLKRRLRQICESIRANRAIYGEHSHKPRLKWTSCQPPTDHQFSSIWVIRTLQWTPMIGNLVTRKCSHRRPSPEKLKDSDPKVTLGAPAKVTQKLLTSDFFKCFSHFCVTFRQPLSHFDRDPESHFWVTFLCLWILQGFGAWSSCDLCLGGCVLLLDICSDAPCVSIILNPRLP